MHLYSQVRSQSPINLLLQTFLRFSLIMRRFLCLVFSQTRPISKKVPGHTLLLQVTGSNESATNPKLPFSEMVRLSSGVDCFNLPVGERAEIRNDPIAHLAPGGFLTRR